MGSTPSSEDGDFVLATAPQAWRSGYGPHRPWSSLRTTLALRIPAARKYPSLKIILAHAGFAVFTAETQVAATVCDNLYLETSWCIGEDIR